MYVAGNDAKRDGLRLYNKLPGAIDLVYRQVAVHLLDVAMQISRIQKLWCERDDSIDRSMLTRRPKKTRLIPGTPCIENDSTIWRPCLQWAAAFLMILTTQFAVAQDVQLEEFVGRVIKVNHRTELLMKVAETPVSVRISAGGNGLPATSILVGGEDKVAILKPKMFIQFASTADENGAPNQTILYILASAAESTGTSARLPFNPHGQVMDWSKPRGNPKELAPTDGADDANKFVYSGPIKNVDLARNSIAVSVDDDRGRPVKYTIAIDPQQTRVRFHTTDLRRSAG